MSRKNQNSEPDHEATVATFGWLRHCGPGLAKISKFNDLTGYVFFASLFHDIAKLIILVVIDQMKQKDKGIPFKRALLMEAMTSLQTQHGCSLKQWNIVSSPAHAVRLGKLVCHKVGIGIYQEETLNLSSAEEIRHLNVSEIDLTKIEILLKDTKILAA